MLCGVTKASQGCFSVIGQMEAKCAYNYKNVFYLIIEKNELYVTFICLQVCSHEYRLNAAYWALHTNQAISGLRSRRRIHNSQFLVLFLRTGSSSMTKVKLRKLLPVTSSQSFIREFLDFHGKYNFQ